MTSKASLELAELTARHDVEWHWVKGHAGHDGNERADALANLRAADLDLARFNQVPYAAANFTASTGVSPLSTVPPMVPRIPEIDLINVIY